MFPETALFFLYAFYGGFLITVAGLLLSISLAFRNGTWNQRGGLTMVLCLLPPIGYLFVPRLPYPLGDVLNRAPFVVVVVGFAVAVFAGPVVAFWQLQFVRAIEDRQGQRRPLVLSDP